MRSIACVNISWYDFIIQELSLSSLARGHALYTLPIQCYNWFSMPFKSVPPHILYNGCSNQVAVENISGKKQIR